MVERREGRRPRLLMLLVMMMRERRRKGNVEGSKRRYLAF